MKKKVLWFILTPILVLAVAGGGAYYYLQTKISSLGDDKSKVVNSVIKEAVTHPDEVKNIMDSITVTDAGQNADSPSADTSQKKDNTPAGTSASSAGKTASAPNSTPAAKTEKTNTASDDSSISSIEYMKSHLNEYELLNSGAKNLGGNTYHLTATVKHKPTGKVFSVEVTTQLSDSMKETLRNYRK
ncbi:MAG: hypothetical protein Q8865_09225 [Bacillota bacterium]|nr:hypothetical protein [Bacillota bacterium]